MYIAPKTRGILWAYVKVILPFTFSYGVERQKYFIIVKLVPYLIYVIELDFSLGCVLELSIPDNVLQDLRDFS